MSLKAAYIVCHPPLIIAEIGQGEEKKIQKTIDAYHRIAQEIALTKPKTIVIISPHALINDDFFHISPGQKARGDFRMFGAPHVSFRVSYDEKLIDRIENQAKQNNIPAFRSVEPHPELDHATMVPLHFINRYAKDYSIVRLAPSMRSSDDHFSYGKTIQKAIFEYGEDVVLVASGDLSHVLKPSGPYGFAEEGPTFDRYVVEAIQNNDLRALFNMEERMIRRAKPCGLSSFQILAGAIDSLDMKSTLESYEGPFGVGYAMASFKVPKDQTNTKKSRAKNPYVALAKESIMHYLTNRTTLKESSIATPAMLSKKAGVFVSLKKHGRLRGCMGTIAPTKEHLAKEIIDNAVAAAIHDPRFAPVTLDEMDQIDLSVDILGPPEPLESIQDHDVNRYGIIVSRGPKKGLLLPRIESVETAESQLEIALMKAGISEDEPFKMERFEVIRHT
jgi:MEMO1 family protein